MLDGLFVYIIIQYTFSVLRLKPGLQVPSFCTPSQTLKKKKNSGPGRGPKPHFPECLTSTAPLYIVHPGSSRCCLATRRHSRSSSASAQRRVSVPVSETPVPDTKTASPLSCPAAGERVRPAGGARAPSLASPFPAASAPPGPARTSEPRPPPSLRSPPPPGSTAPPAASPPSLRSQVRKQGKMSP